MVISMVNSYLRTPSIGEKVALTAPMILRVAGVSGEKRILPRMKGFIWPHRKPVSLIGMGGIAILS